MFQNCSSTYPYLVPNLYLLSGGVLPAYATFSNIFITLVPIRGLSSSTAALTPFINCFRNSLPAAIKIGIISPNTYPPLSFRYALPVTCPRLLVNKHLPSHTLRRQYKMITYFVSTRYFYTFLFWFTSLVNTDFYGFNRIYNTIV